MLSYDSWCELCAIQTSLAKQGRTTLSLLLGLLPRPNVCSNRCDCAQNSNVAGSGPLCNLTRPASLGFLALSQLQSRKKRSAAICTRDKQACPTRKTSISVARLKRCRRWAKEATCSTFVVAKWKVDASLYLTPQVAFTLNRELESPHAPLSPVRHGFLVSAMPGHGRSPWRLSHRRPCAVSSALSEFCLRILESVYTDSIYLYISIYIFCMRFGCML